MPVKLTDTNTKAEKIQVDLLRKLSLSERISRVRSLTHTVTNLSRRAIQRANPEMREDELNLKFIAYHYGNEIAEKYKKYIDNSTS